MRQPCELSLTTPMIPRLEQHLSALVENRLCAAVHQFHTTTIYQWYGINYGQEIRVALHTCTDRTNAIDSAVREWHPYQTFCLIETPLSHGNNSYLAWIISSTE